MNKYYIAYLFQCEKHIGYGELIISNNEKLTMETSKEINSIKEYIKEQTFERDNKEIKNIVVMDFRELKEG